jgi:transcriptional regulator with XRE-family HTH domain
MATTYGERLDRALTHAKKSRAELAQALMNPEGDFGVSVSSIGQVINGTVKAQSAENCARAAKFLGVSHYWLATGLGHMLEPASGLRVEERQAPYDMSDAQALAQLHKMLQRLDAAMRGSAADVLAGWAREGGAEDRSAAILGLLSASGKRAA